MYLTKHALALAVLLATAAAGIAGEKPSAKVEFKGWFSNPVFSADGKVLVFAQMPALPYGARTGPTQIVLWSVPAAKELRRIEGPADDSLVGPIALAPNGKRLAMGLWNTAVRLLDLDTGKEVGRVEGSNGAQHLRFAPDGSSVAWLKQGTIHLTDPATAKELRQFSKDADGPANTLAFVADGKTLITSHSQATDITGAGGGKNRTFKHDITYWARDAVSGKKLYQVGDTLTETRKTLEGPPLCGLFPTADGKTVVIGGDRGVLEWCAVASGKKERELACPWKSPAEDPVRKVTIAGTGQVAAVATARGVVTVWDLTTGKELARMDPAHSIDHLVLSPDGKTLALHYQIGGQVGVVLLIYHVAGA
jgi:WD40 repeat protein